jgi:hypothetical protein
MLTVTCVLTVWYLCVLPAGTVRHGSLVVCCSLSWDLAERWAVCTARSLLKGYGGWSGGGGVLWRVGFR